jgi:hypothetical protein
MDQFIVCYHLRLMRDEVKSELFNRYHRGFSETSISRSIFEIA